MGSYDQTRVIFLYSGAEQRGDLIEQMPDDDDDEEALFRIAAVKSHPINNHCRDSIQLLSGREGGTDNVPRGINKQ